jgi:mannitol operon repressor
MSRLLDGANAPLGTFSARIDASHALGLITDHEEHELHLIRKVRNEFAHSKHGTTFNDQKIGDLCRALRSSVPGEYKDFLDQPRYMFINAVILTSLALTYRGEQIGMQRRSPLTLVAPSMRSSR